MESLSYKAGMDSGLMAVIIGIVAIAVISIWKFGWIGMIQALILTAVVLSNIRWHWTPSGLVAGIVGMGAAWLVTIFPLWLRYRLFHRPPGTPFLDLSVSRFPSEESTQEDVISETIPLSGDRTLRVPPGKRDTLRPPR